MSTLGINRITPSMITEYENCPRLFYYRSFLGLKLPQSQVHFVFGNAIHLAIGNVYEQMDTKDFWKYAKISVAKKVFLKEFTIDALDKNDKNYNNELTYPTEEIRLKKFEEMRDDGLAIIKSFWEKKEELLNVHDINPVEFELIVKIPIIHPLTKEPLEVPMSGRIDSLNYDGGIIEMKTSKVKYHETDTRNLPQALSYVLIRYLQTGRMPPWLMYIVMRKGLSLNSKNRIQILKYYYEEADVLSFVARIESTLEKIRARQFNVPAIGHPPYCDCEKYRKGLDVN